MGFRDEPSHTLLMSFISHNLEENMTLPVKIYKDISFAPAIYPSRKFTKANSNIYTNKFGAAVFEVRSSPNDH